MLQENLNVVVIEKITKYFLLSVFPDGSMDYYKIEDDTLELYPEI